MTFARRLALPLLAALAAVAAPAAAAPPPIAHVFVIVLENEGYATTFAPSSPAAYLARELPRQGQLLTHYYGVGHESLDNYVAMISGQAPNPVTQADCPVYEDFAPGTMGADGQAIGSGCVYPASIKTVADQLSATGRSWGGYMEDMGNSATDPATCRHPAVNSRDATQSARKGDQYAMRHNPFVYFHSIIDSPSCAANDVPLDRLPALLASDQVPSYVFITPNLCHDGHDTPCVDGEPGGLVSADAFLRQWVPMIQASRAFRDGGLLVVTFDEASITGDASSCCVDEAPNTPNAGGPTPGRGGGRTGAVLLSPYIAPGTRNDTPYNHYSLLRSVEDVFGLPGLGLAAKAKGFGDDVYDGRRCFNHPLPAGAPRELPRGLLISSVSRTGRRLSIAMAHAADLYVRAGRRAVLHRHAHACDTVVATLPRGARSATVTATLHGHRERRTARV